jgi:ABC-type nitrate/sulfonate/bicarbonate transport system ATPase subunit
MRRRVAFLASIAANPSIMLLDEPFSAVDEPTRISIHQDVFNVCRRMGTSVLLVTHDIAEAISLCDVIVVLSARPARVSRVYRVPFGDQRDMSTIRTDPRFLESYSHLWRDLYDAVQANRHT